LVSWSKQSSTWLVNEDNDIMINIQKGIELCRDLG